MISHHREFIFLHISKCGGTSIESAFKAWRNQYSRDYFYLGKNRQHFLLNEILREYPECSGYFKFAFIRNPFSRIVSEYNYILKEASKALKHPIAHLKGISFRDFILDLEKHLNDNAYAYHNLSLCDYLLNKEGELVVDFVGRLENFQEDFNKVCPNILLPHEFSSGKNKHYTEYYDDETKQIVAEKYAKDIEYFGYEFGEN